MSVYRLHCSLFTFIWWYSIFDRTPVLSCFFSLKYTWLSLIAFPYTWRASIFIFLNSTLWLFCPVFCCIWFSRETFVHHCPIRHQLLASRDGYWHVESYSAQAAANTINDFVCCLLSVSLYLSQQISIKLNFLCRVNSFNNLIKLSP